ncbi:hypothetical protein JHK86_018238 [Glycine max]|nr:hypothetical protein JHK86_018238 [Glycine max]
MHEAALGDGSFPLKKEEMNNMTTNLSKEVMETLETSFKDNKTRNAKKEGYHSKDKRDANVKKHSKEKRSGCLPHMIVTRQPHGKYQVTHFEAQHNHDNINSNSNSAKMLNLQNEFSVAEAVEADSNNSLGPTKSKSAPHVLNKKTSAHESLDLLYINYDNYLHYARERDLKEGEAGRFN